MKKHRWRQEKEIDGHSSAIETKERVLDLIVVPTEVDWQVIDRTKVVATGSTHSVSSAKSEVMAQARRILMRIVPREKTNLDEIEEEQSDS